MFTSAERFAIWLRSILRRVDNELRNGKWSKRRGLCGLFNFEAKRLLLLLGITQGCKPYFPGFEWDDDPDDDDESWGGREDCSPGSSSATPAAASSGASQEAHKAAVTESPAAAGGGAAVMKPIILSVPTFRPYRKESSASLSHQLASVSSVSSRLNPFATTTAVTESPAVVVVPTLKFESYLCPPGPLWLSSSNTARQGLMSVYEGRAEAVVVMKTVVNKGARHSIEPSVDPQTRSHLSSLRAESEGGHFHHLGDKPNRALKALQQLSVPIARLLLARLPDQPMLNARGAVMWRRAAGGLWIRMMNGADILIPVRFALPKALFLLNNAQAAALRGVGINLYTRGLTVPQRRLRSRDKIDRSWADAAYKAWIRTVSYLYAHPRDCIGLRCALFGLRVSAARRAQAPSQPAQYDFSNGELHHIGAGLLATHPLQPGDDLLEHLIETAVENGLRCTLGRLRLSDTCRDVQVLMGH
ncbi:unnamed protein product [Vitrella brassicaformis CCMP3155]|uniref:Uncharacterized protein n=1 Tax=Vitrella brassicaformis (strain CCMP3155) TaxID=1169540 RepID=A0A0G4EHA4_VITBC|nr:unnamed protein product [Vitrella brassicaformis CCMP3155]|eukprot:CEL95405.1 unnamed protein product [Vitrella brassicaformis CCMP3155]